MGISMLCVGAVHYDDCAFNATTYLVVAGSVMVALNVLTIIALLTPCECDDKLLKVMTPVFSLAQLCIFIWGTVEVFGHYSDWHGEDYLKPTANYCNHTAYMFAFVLLLIQWVVAPILIVLCCCCACFTSCCCD
jgi:hypothetical protein